MNSRVALGLVFFAAFTILGQEPSPQPPRIGKVEILKSTEIKPGMKGYAWTVFQGSEPEAVPVEIIGLMKNSLGPQQDLILAKLGGRAAQTNVAGGMSGSPVYIDGRLVGAVSYSMGQFSREPIAGITPIDEMIQDTAMGSLEN